MMKFNYFSGTPNKVRCFGIFLIDYCADDI